MYFTTEGILGIPLGVSATFVFLFVLFGAFLEKTGIGKLFIDIADAIAGWASGGPAKVAVITSALEGTISGSSVANTVGSGSFTIPMMKKLGYRPEFAGAVEASASTGGQIMPPVMGAAAFLMAEFIGIPYIDGTTGGKVQITASDRTRIFPRPRIALGLPSEVMWETFSDAGFGTPPRTGLPGFAPTSGLPVVASTLAAIAFERSIFSTFPSDMQ